MDYYLQTKSGLQFLNFENVTQKFTYLKKLSINQLGHVEPCVDRECGALLRRSKRCFAANSCDLMRRETFYALTRHLERGGHSRRPLDRIATSRVRYVRRLQQRLRACGCNCTKLKKQFSFQPPSLRHCTGKHYDE